MKITEEYITKLVKNHSTAKTNNSELQIYFLLDMGCNLDTHTIEILRKYPVETLTRKRRLAIQHGLISLTNSERKTLRIKEQKVREEVKPQWVFEGNVARRIA